jgi:hypothetical protein
MAERPAYRRRQHEAKVHDQRERESEDLPDSFSDVGAACTQWLAQHEVRQVKAELVTVWHRPQPKHTLPLALALARSEALELRSVGRITQERIDCEGWADQILDGDREGVLALA